MKDQPFDAALARLNAAERELLILLGQGHTAKSIAVLKGLSELAVNERFRSARRKTGIGSSREIARLLVAQENRDDLIDLAPLPTDASKPPRPDAPPLGRAFLTRRWRPIMITAALLAASLLSYETAKSPTEPNPAPTTLSAQNGPERQTRPDPEVLEAEVANGPRDAAWSPRAEQALSQGYHDVSAFDEDITSVKVTCASTLCEVSGETRPNLSNADRDRLMAAFLTLRPSDEKIRLTSVTHRFGYRPDEQEAGTYVAYWRRRD